MEVSKMQRHPRDEQAAWIKVLLREQFKTVDEFFLYGSSSKIGVFEPQEWENFAEDSDFDFAVQDKAETLDEMLCLGWKKKDELSYQDAQTAHIFEGEIDGQRVQISLRVDLARFKEAWKSVDPVFYWTFLNKRSPSFIGKDAVKTYLDQLFYLLNGVWREYPKEKTLFADLKWEAMFPVPEPVAQVFEEVGVARVELQGW